MEFKKNVNTVKLLFRLKEIEKLILNTSNHLKGIKATGGSLEHYNRCFSIYNEGTSYFFQCCGFLKSQYFESEPSPTGKNFFINSLYIPTYKRFLSLKENLSVVEVNEVYLESFKQLQGKVDYINNALSELLNEVAQTL